MGKGNPNSNWPGTKIDMTPEEMQDAVHAMNCLAKLPPIDYTNPEELEQRIEFYFDFCEKCGLRPGVAGLGMAVGVSRQSLWLWSKEDSERAKIVMRAKLRMEAVTELAGTTGKMNPLVYMYCMSNWFEGYHNTNVTTQVEVTAKPYELPERQEIIKRIPVSPKSEAEPGIDELLKELAENGSAE